MASSYVTFRKVCKHHSIPESDWKLNGQYNFIEFFNGSRIDLLDLAHKPTDPMFERLGSLEYTGGWIEESGEVEFKAFDVLKSRIGRHKNKEFDLLPKMFCTTNPNKGWQYRLIYKPWKSGTLNSKYAFIPSLFGDNPYTADSYREQLSDISDKATKERLMFGNWEYDDADNALIKYEHIVDLFTNVAEKSDKKYLIADIARYGGDRIVIGIWQGLALKRVLYYNKKDTAYTTRLINDLMVQEQIPRSYCLVDEDGVGGGVKDQLPGINGFVNNSSALEVMGEKQNYANLKTQCAYLLAKYVNLHKIAVEEQSEEVRELLTEELEQLKSRDLDKDGKLKIIQKEKTKELLGRSPDFLDMMIMRMYFEIKPATRGINKLSKNNLNQYI